MIFPYPLDRNREYSRDCIETTAELGGHLAAVTEARVQAAIDVVAGEGEFRGGCPAERLGETGGDHLPVTLYRDGGGPAGAQPELGARSKVGRDSAARSEARVESTTVSRRDGNGYKRCQQRERNQQQAPMESSTRLRNTNARLLNF